MKVEFEQLTHLLPRVEKPARYVGGEFNQIVKDDGVNVRLCLAFPDVYEIGVSYHGFRILYERVNAREGWAAERAFAPWPDFESQMRDANIPLYALESFLSLDEFDVIGFTLQSEANYSNVVNMLDLAGLPVRSDERLDAFPLVIAGGEGAMAPEPMSRFIDAFVIGDGEEVLIELMQTVQDYKASGGNDRPELLQRVGAIEGVYVPSTLGEEQTVKRRVWDIGEDVGSLRPIVPNLRAVHERKVIEIRRGCARGCRFCHAGMTNRPVRERSTEQVLEAARKGLEATGHNDLSLLSLSTTDHTCLGEMMGQLSDEFVSKNVSISLPSLRVNSFDIALANEISKVRKTGFTFAPEAGTERLRAVINKELDDDTFLGIIRQVFESGWSTVKFYFMLGLPTETDSDLEGIVSIIRKAESIGRQVWKGRLKINVTLSPFVPKPHTPFQWAAQVEPDEMMRRANLVRDQLRSKRIDIKVSDARSSQFEAAIARGDRRVGEAIENAWRLGARFDGWREQFRFDLWEQAFADTGIGMSHYANRERDLDEVLPWDHIDVGLGTAFLKKEWRLATEETTTPDCTRGDCAGCRACRPGEKDHSLVGEYEATPTVPKMKRPPAPKSKREPKGKRRDEGPPPIMRLRLFLAKTGRLRFISHLDLASVLAATMTRAKVPVAFSQGFHPHPLITLPPPLSLGYSAEAEPIECQLRAIIDPEEARQRLNDAAPDGLRFVSAKRFPPMAQSMSKQFVAADFQVTLPDGFAQETELNEALDRFAAADEWVIKKQTKRAIREIDLKTSVHIGERSNTSIEMLISLTQGKYIDPLQALTALLERPVTQADGVSVNRRKIVM